MLSTLSFNYKTGPWKRTYVKFGYNPKIDLYSMQYQIIDIVIKEKNDIDYFRFFNQNKNNLKKY